MIDTRSPAERRRDAAILLKRAGKLLKIWLPIFLSVIAIVLSGLSAYVTTFVLKDDLRVVIGKAPTFLLKKNGDVSVSGISEITFINGGNRQALIMEPLALITKLENFADENWNCRTQKST